MANADNQKPESQLSSEQCAVCGKLADAGEQEVWVTECNTVVRLHLSSVISASVSTSLGEIDICERCYKDAGQLSRFCREDLRKIHEQFGLEYQMRRNWRASIKALSCAASIYENASILFNLGVSYEGIRDDGHARQFYRRALRLDPGLVFARCNLARLDGR